MMLGLGNGTTATAPATITTTAPSGGASFTQGLAMWSNPAVAMLGIQELFASPSQNFTAANAPAIAGLLLPPVALVGILIAATSGGKR